MNSTFGATYRQPTMIVKLKLRELAEQRNLNLSQVQRETGLTMGLVRRYWYNDTSSVQLDAICKLALLLDVMPGELFEFESATHST